MSNNTRLQKAKQYIQKGEDYYRQAADEIVEWLREDPTRSHSEAAAPLGKSRQWVSQLVQWRTSGKDPVHSPFGGEAENGARYERQARTVLRDPERRQKALAELDTPELNKVASEATNVLVDRARTHKAEQSTSPTVGDLLDGERWDPGESWADTLIVRVYNNAKLLDAHVKKHGFVLGSMREDEAFEYLQGIERIASDLRAAVQERIADRVV